MQRAQAYLPFVLRSLRHNVWPSSFPILPSTAPGPRFRRHIDVHIIFWIRELARFLKFKCCAAQRRLEQYHGPRDSSQWFCCHDCWSMSQIHQVLLHTLRILMQIVSNQLVELNNGGFRSPFVASGCLLLLAWVVISGSWSENYGGGGGPGTAQLSTDVFQIRRLGAAWRIVAAGAYNGSSLHVYGLNLNVDPILLVLGLTQTIFEGSMYLFVFIWVPTLQESSLSPSSLPLGYIFSAFMVSMMLGSLLYTFITVHWYPPSASSGLQKHARSASVGSTSPSSQGDSSLVLHAQLSSLVCAASAVTFAACVRVGKGKGEEGEHLKFWAFCLFEACVGMYYPVQGMLRGSLISNEHRATVSPLPLEHMDRC